MGLLSHTISVQGLQESIPKILSLKRKEGENREGESHGREEGGVLLREKERERGEGGERYLSPTNSRLKD